MNLIKTSLLNGIAVVIKVLSSLVLNKILAVYVGPAGYAIIGQFQNAVAIVVSLGGGVVATGVTKGTAQHFDDEFKQHTIWQTSIRFSLYASLIAGIILLFLRDVLSEWLLHQADMSGIFVWLALVLPAMAVNNLLLAIVNGKKEVGIFVTVNIIGSLLGVLVSLLLVLNFGLHGALIAFTINPAIGLLSTGALVARRCWFNPQFLWGRINRSALLELSGFGLMGLVTALTTPISYMLIRDHLVTSLGLSAAGYWQASWKISETYLMLLTTPLSVYYLPRLAEIRIAAELRAEIIKVYRIVMPVVVVGALFIFNLRDFIIHTLFTTDFLNMRELFPWQLAGDVIKIGSWVLSFVMLGRAMIKICVITQIIFSATFVLWAWLLVNFFGLTGVSMAYALNYLLYWISMGFMVQYELRRIATV